ncbi:unnamed protein product [Acanthoscelides obtectus]|uniref:Uncharacterized protein n=1 Tax=Acanthoscelides obtectus TaxID=200917 RepID=A0A9P0KEF5_ACAOB|nr:unnamed protein product [Acanthoscelides obtectus]CAK1633478.1 hypothetical protein AOBTE_LOCUS8164 [Acanthoscelides obtectus]
MHSARHAIKILCDKSEIQKHSSGKQHTKLVKSLHTHKTLTDMTSYMEKISLNNKFKTVEIRIATYAAEHNISFNTLNHLSEIIRISFDDSEIAKNFTCSRTKATAIVNNVLGQYSFKNSINLLQTNKFSLIADSFIQLNIWI